ncbi:hypothetical protein E8E11_005907 [Didymella keratinophila]|nr:hypothetical protein E8E11_005907 [Didymella keratinophila]
MDASDGQALIDAMSNEILGVDQERVDAAPSHEDNSVDDLVEAKPQFQCMDCKKPYVTKKSLQRHLSSTGNACIGELITHGQITAHPVKTRWSAAGDEDAFTSNHNPTKRKRITSPGKSPERAHKDKRSAPDQRIIDYGEHRVVDPLGGQAHVSPRMKKAAASDWLNEQSSKSASAVSTSAQAHDEVPYSNQAGSMQAPQFNSYQPDQSFNQSYASDGNLPPPASFLPSQQGTRMSTPNHQQHPPYPRTAHGQSISNYGATASSRSANLPHPPPFDGLPSMTAGRPMQYSEMYFQMEILRQRNLAHDLEMTKQYTSRNGMGPSPAPQPFGASGPLTRGFDQTQGQFNSPSLQVSNPGHLRPSHLVLLLRIHSNTHDRNGQPIFSILRMRADDNFGPRLDAYCANRGKAYGEDWVFVYRYQIGPYQNPGHDRQITLTWDMTPADVKVDGLPGISMRNMDTIYVMKAEQAATAGIKREMSEDGTVQASGPQLSHQVVDIVNGETTYFQNPDITRQWTQAIEKDNAQLRASHHQMQTVIAQLRQDLNVKKQQNTELNTYITELTKVSKEYREMVQREVPNLNASGADADLQIAPFSLSKPPAGRVARQRPDTLHQPVQQRPPRKVNPAAEYYKQRHVEQAAAQRTNNDFIKECEAMRDPNEQVPQQLQPIQFPSFGSRPTVPDFSNELNMDFAFPSQVNNDGRFFDAAGTAAA